MAGTKWEKNKQKNSGIFMWVIDKKDGPLFHQIPWWNASPPKFNPNYITWAEKRLIKFLWSEGADFDKLDIKWYLRA